jgi:hypothetical protein
LLWYHPSAFYSIIGVAANVMTNQIERFAAKGIYTDSTILREEADRMREFKSLHPEGRAYDVEGYREDPIVTVEEAEGRIIIHYTFPGFFVSDDTRYVEGEEILFKKIKVAQTGVVIESGKPLLPSFGRYVQIPFSCDYEIAVEKSSPTQFEDIVVLPAQEMLTDTEDEAFEYDRQFYDTDQFYPEDIVEVSGPFEIDGYTALLLHVRPLQYNPSRKKLYGFSTITVTIDVTTPELQYTFSNPELDRKAYGNLLLNPKRRIEGRLLPGVDITIPFSAGPPGPDFLILYHDPFKESAERLAQWKRVRGLYTEIVSIEEVGHTVDAIKSYIRIKKASDSQLQYVLLFGDVEVIPSERIRGSIYRDINATDYYYSTEGDPHDAREYLFSWLSVGRIPVQTAEEAMAVVDQIIAYEKNPPEDPEYYTRMVVSAHFEDRTSKKGRDDKCYVKTMEEIRDHMVTCGFAVKRVYTSNNPDITEYSDGTEISDEVKDAIMDGDAATDTLISAASEGYLLVGHRDHGDAYGWQHPRFTKDHLDAVTSDIPTMVYSINCLTGRFDLSEQRDSFAERILKMRGGAPSLIAATRKSYPPLNDALMKALFDAMWAGVLPTYGSAASYSIRYNRLGDILTYGKAYLPTVVSSPRHIKDHFEIFHVIGDPTLELLKASPLEMNMHVKRSQEGLDISISACPNGSVITVWHKDQMLKRVEPYFHSFKVPVRDIASSEEISVCFWAPGYRFTQISV